jgi:hypothetical protein
MSTTKLSRRAIVAGAAATVPLASASVAAVAASVDDAELLALGAQLDQILPTLLEIN